MVKSTNYIVKHILKNLSEEECDELISFLDSYKYRYLDNNRSTYLFLPSNLYSTLINKEILAEYKGIIDCCIKDFISVFGGKDKFKKHIISYAYKNEREDLKSIVDKYRKFDDLYNWLYNNEPTLISKYIELQLKGQKYSSYSINPKVRRYIWLIYKAIDKNKREKYLHTRDKVDISDNSIWNEIETMFS